jgi:hypothetical protein
MIDAMRLIAVAIVLVFARAASATGPCEDTDTRYDPPELFDEATRSFAIPAAQPWCDVKVTNDAVYDEVRGAVSFVELRDVRGNVLERLSTAQGSDADHLTARGAFTSVPFGKLHATLVQRGYKPLVAATKCKLEAVWSDLDPPGGWRGANLSLDVEHAGKRLARSLLGRGSVARRGDQIIRSHVLANAAGIAVFAIVPSCAGPPPGYFGSDDPGNCYNIDTPVVTLLAPSPALAACF